MIEWCPKGKFCGGWDSKGVALKKTTRSCPDNSVECSKRNNGVVRFGDEYFNLCSLVDLYNSHKYNPSPSQPWKDNVNPASLIINADDAPGLLGKASCQGRTRLCKQNEADIDGRCQCNRNYYRHHVTCLPCPLGHLCDGGSSTPQLLKKEGYYALPDGDHVACQGASEGACNGAGYYPVSNGVYNSACCRFSTVLGFGRNEFVKGYNGASLSKQPMRVQCTEQNSCKACGIGSTRINGVCTKCLATELFGLWCPGGGTWHANKNYFEDADPKLCPVYYSCNNGQKEECDPKEACNGLGFYSVGEADGERYIQSKVDERNMPAIVGQEISQLLPLAIDDLASYTEKIALQRQYTDDQKNHSPSADTTFQNSASRHTNIDDWPPPVEKLVDNDKHRTINDHDSLLGPIPQPSPTEHTTPTPPPGPRYISPTGKLSDILTDMGWGIRFYFPGMVGDQDKWGGMSDDLKEVMSWMRCDSLSNLAPIYIPTRY